MHFATLSTTLHFTMEMATSSNFKFTLPLKNTRYMSMFHGLKHQHSNSFNKCFKLQSLSPRIVSATTNIASDMYVGRNNSNKIYTNLNSCLVIPPPTSTKPRAIIKFIGGAFIGAIPQLTYGYWMLILFSLTLLFFWCKVWFFSCW